MSCRTSKIPGYTALDMMSEHDRLCYPCADLNPLFYLGRLFTRFLLDDIVYPSSDRSVADVLEEKACPLCRLVARAFEQQIDSPGTEIKQHCAILKFRYVQSDSLTDDKDPKPPMPVLGRSLLSLESLFLEVLVNGNVRLALVHLSLEGAPLTSRAPSSISLAVPDGPARQNVMPLSEASGGLRLLTKDARRHLNSLLPGLSELNFMKARRVMPTVNTELLTTWIEHCATHGDECQPAALPSSLKPSVRMIDLQKRMTVSMAEIPDENPRFAALSYVWGKGVKQLENTTIGGVDELLRSEGFLSDDNQDIPNTIKDAMKLCQRLNIRYLWVDAICLNQDRVESDTGLPENGAFDPFSTMGQIYTSALVTIVAAGGENSWVGLPGISPRPMSDVEEPIDGKRFILYRGPVTECIQNTLWNRRAWTFQEMILSKRLLVFTREEILYECDAGHVYRESITAEHPDLPSKRFEIPLLESGFKRRLELPVSDNREPEKVLSEIHFHYTWLLAEYLHRRATKSSDVLRAVEGIMSKFTAITSCRFSYGVMVDFFLESIVFNVSSAHPSYYRKGFPSWSWAGWDLKGKASLSLWDPNNVSWLDPGPQLYHLDPETGLNGFEEGGRKFVAIENSMYKAPIKSLELVDYQEDWRRWLCHMLAFKGETLLISVARDHLDLEQDTVMEDWNEDDDEDWNEDDDEDWNEDDDEDWNEDDDEDHGNDECHDAKRP